MNNTARVAILVAIVVVIAGLLAVKRQKTAGPAAPPVASKGLPRLLDLGAKSCIPCKMMAPILEELKREYAGRMDVEFIDVWENEAAAHAHQIKTIPTQIFFDASGKELFRHVGFYSKEDILGKWKELGLAFTNPSAAPPAFERLEPSQADTRPKDAVCYMCDGDIPPKTCVLVKTDKGDVRLCSPHCYFILYSSLTQDRTGIEKQVSVTDWATGQLLAATAAVCLYGVDETTGRRMIKAFGDRAAALKERERARGSVIGWELLQAKELATRCGFCDRAVYPEDAAVVRAEGLHTWGCCSHCALGVAARTGKDIEVIQKDRLAGERVVVKTLNGSVASLDPPSAVAWFGLRKRPDGDFASAGCFHQWFFVSAENLRKGVEQNPCATGKQITIHQALADKMKLTPQQIAKACKIGECAPK